MASRIQQPPTSQGVSSKQNSVAQPVIHNVPGQQKNSNATANAPVAEELLSSDSHPLSLGTSPATTSITLNFRVQGAKNIRGAKGEHVNSFVRVQFADFDFKDTSVAIDTSAPEYNFNFEQSFNVDENLIDIFNNKKVTLTLIESLPKEKTQVLGTAETRLNHFLKYPPRDPNLGPDVPLSLPSTTFKENLPITYLNPKLLPPPPKDGETSNAPELIVEASISSPLLAPESVETGNFLTFKLDCLFPVPDDWTLKEGTEKDMNSNIYTYSLSFQLPAESSLERTVTIPGGVLINSETNVSDSPTLGPQPIHGRQTENASSDVYQSTDGSSLESPVVSSNPTTKDPISTNSPDTSKPDSVPTTPVKMIAWNTNHTVWVPPEAVIRLREKIMSKMPIEAEFFRELQPKFAHLTDANAAKYRGKLTIDLSCLLYPRVVGLRGRFGFDVGYEAPSTAQSDGTFHGSVNAAGPNSGEGAIAPVSSAKAKGIRSVIKDEISTNVFKNLGSHIGIEIMMEKPLLDKKKLQPISKSVRDFIPHRSMPASMIYEKRSKKADDDYKFQIENIIRSLLKEYETVLKTDFVSTDMLDELDIVNPKNAQEEQQRRKKFLFHLNKSGAYFSFKERLKSAVVNIVRERFQKKSPFAAKSELQLFMSEVYVYLIDQMHIAVNKLFKDPEMAFVDPTVSKTADFTLLKQFADQKEADNNISIAASYHQERIAKYEDSMQTWFDYGSFCMRNNMPEKGSECFKEILSRNDKHLPSLIAYGAITCCNENYEEARVYLVTAVEIQPKYTLAQTILGLFYEVIGEDLEAEKYLKEAEKLHKETQPHDAPSHLLSASEFLIQIHAGHLAERALSHELLSSGASVKPHLLLAQLEIQRRNYVDAGEHINSALEVQQDDPDSWAFLGNLQYIQKLSVDARWTFETVLSLPKEPSDVSSIYIRLGNLYLSMKNGFVSGLSTPAEYELAKKAKSMYLRACESKPSSQSWLGVGKACIALGEYEQAEDALAEANVINNRDGEVWAYLSLLCLSQERFFEANQCISQALRHGVKQAEILCDVGNAFLKVSQAAPAAECFRMALELEPHNNQSIKALFTKALAMQSKDFLRVSHRDTSQIVNNATSHGDGGGSAKGDDLGSEVVDEED